MDCCRMGRGRACATPAWALPWQDGTPHCPAVLARCSVQPEPGCWWLIPPAEPCGSSLGPQLPQGAELGVLQSARLHHPRMRPITLLWAGPKGPGCAQDSWAGCCSVAAGAGLGAAGRLRSHTLSTTAPRLGETRGDAPESLAVGAAAAGGLPGGCRGCVWPVAEPGRGAAPPAGRLQLAGRQRGTAARESGGELSPGPSRKAALDI